MKDIKTCLSFFYGAAWTTALLILFRTLNIHVFLRIIRNEQKY